MENGKWKMENGKWRMENGKWRMENGEWKMENGKWRMENTIANRINHLGGTYPIVPIRSPIVAQVPRSSAGGVIVAKPST
jgi:hypothetical protein